jgi:cyclase
MIQPRVIPCLLLRDGALVKTRQFGDATYIGDPINAVRIFNEKESDELIVLDISASSSRREPDFQLISKLARECRMPFCYGGGITTVDQAARIVDMGVEKVSLSSAAINDLGLVSELAGSIGTQSVVVTVDVRAHVDRHGEATYAVYTLNGKNRVAESLDNLALRLAEAGAGEIVINSIDKDGTMAGFDVNLARKIKGLVSVPLTVLGGCGSLNDMSQLVGCVGLVGVAAGSFFVFKGRYRAVLINYPSLEKRSEIFKGVWDMPKPRVD